MKIKRKNSLIIELKGKNATMFKSGLDKLISNENKVGFKQSLFDEDEIKVFKDLIDEINVE